MRNGYILMKPWEFFVLMVFVSIGILMLGWIALISIHEYFEVQNFYSQGNYNLSEFVVIGWLRNGRSAQTLSTGWGGWNNGNESVVRNWTFNDEWDRCWKLNLSACNVIAHIRWKE